MSTETVATKGAYALLSSFFGSLRAHSIIYLLGMVLIFLGERVVGGDAWSRWALDGVGLLAVLGALALFAKGMALAPTDAKAAHRLGLVFGLIGLASVGVYALSSDLVVAALHFADDDTENRYTVVISGIWPILWLVGTLPMFEVDRALGANPVVVVPARVREAAAGALSLSLALAMLFPLNYIAQDMNKRWDFGYFKTARPGTATKAMVDSLDQPLDVYLFFPSSSDVTDELRTYFDELKGGELQVHYVDHALEPELAKELKVRDNGYVVFARGEGDDQQVEKVKIGDDFDSAKRKLKKLDSEIQTALLKVARGQKTAYFTVGHGELYWKSGEDVERKISNLKKVFEAINYKVKELGLTEGLANEVPEDADMVVILGAQSDFLPEELAALDAYRKQGGSLLVGLEPDSPSLAPVLDPIGIGVQTTPDAQEVLANDSKFVPVTYRIADRVNTFTNKYSTHASVTTLSRNSKVLFLITPNATPLVEEPGTHEGKATVTIRSLPDTWADRDGDLEFDADTEQRKVYTIGMAASGPVESADAPAAAAKDAAADEDAAADKDAAADEDAADDEDAAADKDVKDGGKKEGAPKAEEANEWRVVALGDATWASDLALPLDTSKANFQLAVDSIAWLGHEDDTAGTTLSEEDVKIQHTKEGQGWLFYGTAFLMPFGLFGLGLTRIRLRKKRGAE